MIAQETQPKGHSRCLNRWPLRERLQLELRNELAKQYSDYLSAWQRVQEYDETMLPKSRRAVEMLDKSYRERRATWISALDAKHPQATHLPTVDRDFCLIAQEFQLRPNSSVPDTLAMEWNYLSFNGRCGPYTTPMLCKLGERVRIRFVNFSVIDHHPLHLHGHTFWVTGSEGGRIPDPAWVPSNNVLVGVAQAREIEFIANNPGDWILHCHMFHHMMNSMTSQAGPIVRQFSKPNQFKIPALNAKFAAFFL